MFKNYGVEHPLQNKEIHNKQQKSGFKLKQYKDTNLYYRGLYELDLIEKYHDKYPDLQNGPSIKYIFNEKNKIYHSDFYIPSLNLVIEIKNSHLAKRDKEEIELKKQSVIEAGFNYIMIVDKNYSKFENLI